MNKKNLEILLKKDEVIVDFEYVLIGTDEEGYPQYEASYIKPPKNFGLVRFIAGLNCVILKDLTVK